MQRRIVCAAMRNAEGKVLCSARHWDTQMHAQVRDSKSDWSGAEQGFIDQKGVFLTREEAHVIAKEAGQIIRRCGGDEKRLYSENLY